jgi:hypothetical protein
VKDRLAVMATAFRTAIGLPGSPAARSGAPPPAPHIVGMARSGTTLLRLMLDASSRLAIPPETGFLDPLLALERSGALTPEAALLVFTGHYDWSGFGLEGGALLQALGQGHPLSAGEAIRIFHRLYGARFGKTRWGDKTPFYVTRIDALAAALPEAVFLHVIRDCRAVVASLRDLWFAPSRDPAEIAGAWVQTIGEGRRLGSRVQRYHEVSYETLVRHPEAELRRICRLLELPFEPAMLAYHRRAAARLAEAQTVTRASGEIVATGDQRRACQRLTAQPPLPDRIEGWRAALSAADVAAVEAAAGPTLQDLGYRLSRPGHGPGTG